MRKFKKVNKIVFLRWIEHFKVVLAINEKWKTSYEIKFI